MPVNGPFTELRKEIERIGGIGKGRTAHSIRQVAQQITWSMVTRGWDSRISPYGKPWKPGKFGAGDLKRSGNLRQGLQAQDRPNGFALIVKAKARNGKYYGGVHQYGKTIKAKGYNPARYKIFSPLGRVSKHRLRGKYNAFGAKPLFIVGENGKFARAWKVRVPARPMLPRKGDLPQKWDRDIRLAIAGFLNNQRSFLR